MRKVVIRIFIITLIVVFTLSACGSDEEKVSGDATIKTANTSLGSVLVDKNGITLYTSPSGCEEPDPCTLSWSPLTGDAVASSDLDQSLVNTISRSDGSQQITYNGHPLYYWFEDKVPGDIKGHRIPDFLAIDKDGNVIS